ERQARGRGRRLRERHAHEQRPDKAGTLRDRDGAEIAPSRGRLVERAVDNAADVADVLPRRQLGNDAAPFAMDLRLRRDNVRADGPGPRRVAGFLDDSRRCLVAGGLDAENPHGCGTRQARAASASNALASDSTYG